MKRLLATVLTFSMLFSFFFVDGSMILTALASGKSYYGLFDDKKSDGGFEYEAWKDEPTGSSNTSKSSKSYSNTVYHRGNKSAQFTFGSSEETFAIYMTFEDLNDIDIFSDYCWTAWIKTVNSKFRGSVALKMVDGDKPTDQTGLTNNKKKTEVELVGNLKGEVDWKRYDSSKSLYTASAIQQFLTGKSKVTVVMYVTGKNGTVYIDDLDFKMIEMLNEDEEIEKGDNTGADGGDYSGLFDDATSDGGFESKSWKKSADDKVQKYDMYVKNTGRRSSSFVFDGTEKTSTIYTTFDGLDEFSLSQNYCWTASVKTTEDFDGTVSLKLGVPNAPEKSGILNFDRADNTVIYNAATSEKADKKWKSFNAADSYYTAGSISQLINSTAEVTESGKVGLYITVTATNGTVWLDDINLEKRYLVLGDDDTFEAGAYEGLFDDKNSNGGFEHGLWEKVAAKTTIIGKSKVVADTEFVKTGTRAAGFTFANGISETVALKMTFKDIKDIDKNSDYFWKTYIKSGAGFDGTVSLKITEYGNEAAALTADDGSTDCVVFNATADGGNSAYTSATTVTNRYDAAAIKEFVERASVKKDGFDVILTVNAKNGCVWVDDVDLLSFEAAIDGICLEDPDTAYDVADGDYTGFFDEASSNGGFEYGPWALVKKQTTAQTPSAYYTDTASKKTGKRSLSIDFANSTKEKLVFKMTSYKAGELENADYVLSAFIKTAKSFEGKVSLKITKAGDSSAVLKNSGGSNETVLLDNAVYTNFARNDSSATPFKAADIESFKALAGGGFDVYLIVEGKGGKIQLDDIDLLTAERLEEIKNTQAEGAKYDGIFVNGGFENGVWSAENLAGHGVEEDDELTYNESLKSMRVNSVKATGHEGALKLSGQTVKGEAAKLDTSIAQTITAKMRTDGSFKGSVYVEFESGSTTTDRLYLIKDATVTYNDWKEISTPTFGINGSDIKIKLYIDGEGSLLLDNINITEDPDHDNLAVNGSFVNGAWAAKEGIPAGASVGTEYDTTHNSATAMRITGLKGKETWTYTGNKVKLDPSKEYKITLSMKTVNADLGSAYIMVLYVDGKGQSKWAVYRGSEHLASTGGTTDWTTKKIILSDVPEWAVSCMIYARIKGEGILFVDNLYMTDKVSEEDYKITQTEGKYDGVLYNGGFEAGHWDVANLNEQKITLDTENTHNGSNAALKVETFKQYANRDKAFKVLTYTVSDFAKDWDLSGAYRIALYTKTSDDFNGSVYVRITQDGAYKWYNWSTELLLLGTVNTGSVGYKDWTYIYSPTFEISDSDISLELWVDGVGTAWIDDVNLIPDPEASNYIANGGFESGMWGTFGSDSAEGKEAALVTDVTDGTAKAGRISSTVDEGEIFIVGSNSKPIDPTKTYTLSFSYKTEGVSESGAYGMILQHFTNENGTNGTSWLTFYGAERFYLSTDKDGWQKFSITCNKWNSALTGIWLYLRLEGGGTVWFDNVELKEKVVDTNIPAGTVGSDTAEGAVDAGTAIRLFTTDPAGDIYYTVDGSNPKTSKTVYLYDDIYGINVTHDMTVKAYVVSEEAKDGEVSEFTYTCDGFVKEDSQLPLIKTNGTAALDTANKKSGKNSIKLKGNGSSIYASTNHIKLDTAFDYKVEFWVKTDGMMTEDSAYVSLFLAGSGGNELYAADKTKGAYYIDPTKLCKIEPTQDWTHYELVVSDMYGQWQSLNLTAGINNDMGTMWIDGIKITALPYDKHPLTVKTDDAVYGNIYTQSTLSSFAINQGFIFENAANTLENGTVTFEIVNDAEPDEIIGTGELEVGVMGKGKGAYSQVLSAIAKYGTYTVKFYMQNSRGKEYYVGDIAVSRIKDASALTQESLTGVCANAPMNTSFSDEQVKKMYQSYADAGLGLLRVDLDWESVGLDGDYSIPEVFDRRIRLAKEYNIDHLIIFNSHISAPGGGSIFPDTAEERASFVEYVKFVVNHFKGVVDTYELFNETDLFHNTLAGPEVYATLLKDVYTAIKSIDPSIKLIGGVTSGINYGFLEGLFKAGGADYMDYVSVHPYIYPESPEAADWKNKVNEVKNVLKRYSDKDLPVMLTEMGYTTIRTADGTTEQQKLDYFVRAFLHAESLGYIDRITMYTTNISLNNYALENMWGLYGGITTGGLISTGGAANPVIAGIAAFNNMMSDYSYVKEQSFADGLYTYKFTNGNGKDMYALWTDDVEKSAEITATDSIKVTDIFGNSESVDSEGDTYFTDVGSKVIYVTLASDAKIESIVLKDKNGNSNADGKDDSSKDDSNGSSADSSDDYDDYEYSDYEEEDLTDGEDKVVKKKRRRITKVVRSGGSDNGGIAWWVWVIIGSSVLLLAALTTVFIIVLKKKKRKKALNS